GFQREVLEAAMERGLPMIAGAMTPTEIVQAHAQGSAMVKVFPAGPLGPDYIRLILSPLKDIPLVPTGGITDANAAGFIAAWAAGLSTSYAGTVWTSRACSGRPMAGSAFTFWNKGFRPGSTASSMIAPSRPWRCLTPRRSTGGSCDPLASCT